MCVYKREHVRAFTDPIMDSFLYRSCVQFTQLHAILFASLSMASATTCSQPISPLIMQYSNAQRLSCKVWWKPLLSHCGQCHSGVLRPALCGRV